MREGCEQVAMPIPHGRVDLRRFLVIAVQLGLVLAAAYMFGIEETYGFPRILPLIFFGFLIHAWLPLPHRSAFFLLLSLASITVILGGLKAIALVAIGLSLIAICHLPFSLGVRVLLLLGAGATLAAIRIEWIHVPGAWSLSFLVLPILAAMFMFRLAVYLYDLHHEKEAVPITQRLAYFFLLPNVCFPLFPVLDHRGFQRSYYSADAGEIYQKGVRWITRGIIHLLLYRLVYQYFTPVPAEINDLGGVAQYMVSSYLLYLRVSGMFHMIAGVLCLYGYNLTETHRLYFLAYSFNDFWRRINIYWKDFMMKMVYYPLFMRLREWGMLRAMVVATMATLIASWMLHSYQWFWLRGSFELTLQDGVFWTLLGLAVAVNSVYEAKFGRKRALGRREPSFRDALVLSLKTVAMFCTMCVLWSFWTSSSVDEWLTVISVAADSTALEITWAFAIVASAVALGTLAQLATHKTWTLSREKAPAFARSAMVTCAIAVSLLVTGMPQVQALLGGGAQDVVAALKSNELNVRDRERRTAGYYEELLGNGAWAHAIWTLKGEMPRDWTDVPNSGAARWTGDIRRYELLPNVHIEFKYTDFRTNRWGMRDQDYEMPKPPVTLRVLLLGDLHTMGSGVEHEQTFESLLEERLNRERPDQRYARYEILNAAVGGYSVLQSAAAVGRQAAELAPDAIVYVTARSDIENAAERLADAVQEGANLEFPDVQEIVDRAGVRKGMTKLESVKLLAPFASDLVRWAYRTIVAAANEQHAFAVWVMLPVLFESPAEFDARFERVAPLAREAGFAIVNLRGTYDGYVRELLWVAPWDEHPGVKAHQLIAAKLYQELAKNWRILFPEHAHADARRGLAPD